MAENVQALLGDNAISSQQAAQRLATPCRDAFEKDGDLSKLEQELDGLWSAILTAAEQTPHDRQDKLVDIMRAIKHMAQPVNETKKLVIWDQEQRWEQLPMFGAKAREQLDIGKARNLLGYGNCRVLTPEQAQERSDQAFVNINGFFARITAADVADLSLFAIWIIREALEDPTEEEIARKTPPKLLKAAAVWLIYAGDALAEASKAAKQFDGKIAKPGASLSTFKDEAGWRGFCEDRWKVWQSRLKSIEEPQVSSEVRSLVDKALSNSSNL
ncbi:hypothetical protein F66182_2388 [Fusarium sp. NRRL 66182]|nr:hypothetical protein F66182_2388 [Fusarium sp. NRRL 66182]